MINIKRSTRYIFLIMFRLGKIQESPAGTRHKSLDEDQTDLDHNQ